MTQQIATQPHSGLLDMTDDEWREALDAEIAAQDTAEERFGLMLGAMIGADELAQLLDTVDYENSMDEAEWIRRGC